LTVSPEDEERFTYCPKCGGELTYFEKYDRQYCYACKTYDLDGSLKCHHEKPRRWKAIILVVVTASLLVIGSLLYISVQNISSSTIPVPGEISIVFEPGTSLADHYALLEQYPNVQVLSIRKETVRDEVLFWYYAKVPVGSEEQISRQIKRDAIVNWAEQSQRNPMWTDSSEKYVKGQIRLETNNQSLVKEKAQQLHDVKLLLENGTICYLSVDIGEEYYYMTYFISFEPVTRASLILEE